MISSRIFLKTKKVIFSDFILCIRIILFQSWAIRSDVYSARERKGNPADRKWLDSPLGRPGSVTDVDPKEHQGFNLIGKNKSAWTWWDASTAKEQVARYSTKYSDIHILLFLNPKTHYYFFPTLLIKISKQYDNP